MFFFDKILTAKLICFSVILGPERMVTVPPRMYCIIENPVVRNNDKVVQFDAAGQAKLNHSDLEVRLTQDPFPLYPGEILKDVSFYVFFLHCPLFREGCGGSSSRLSRHTSRSSITSIISLGRTNGWTWSCINNIEVCCICIYVVFDFESGRLRP